MANEALCKLLSNVPLFRDLIPDELTVFLRHCKQEEIPGHYAIVEQGESGRHFYAVMSGAFDVCRKLDNGKEVVLAALRPGDVFGELALVDNDVRSATVRSKEPSRLLTFDRNELAKMPPELAVKLYRNLAMLMAAKLRRSNGVVSVMLAQQQDEPADAEPNAPDNGFSAPKQRTVIHRG